MAVDREMLQLCEKDGGIKVFEQVVIPSWRLDRSGTPRASENYKEFPVDMDPQYELRIGIEVLRRGSPELTRHAQRIIRKSDG